MPVEVTQEAEVTRIIEVTRLVPEIMTVVVFPTDEPVPPTAEVTATLEPLPTDIPLPAATLEPAAVAPTQSHTSADVIAAFQAAGLEVGATTAFIPQSDPSLTPKTYTEGTRFVIPSL